MNKARKVRCFRGFPGESGTKNPPKSHGDRGDMGGKGKRQGQKSLPFFGEALQREFWVRWNVAVRFVGVDVLIDPTAKRPSADGRLRDPPLRVRLPGVGVGAHYICARRQLRFPQASPQRGCGRGGYLIRPYGCGGNFGRLVGVDVLIDPCREAAFGRRAAQRSAPTGAVGIYACSSAASFRHVQNTSMACSSSATGGRLGAMRMLLSFGSFP